MTDPHATQTGLGLPNRESLVELWPLYRAPDADAIEATLAPPSSADALILFLDTALMVGDQFVLRHTGETGRAVWLCTVTRSTRLPHDGFRIIARGACIVHDQDVQRTPSRDLLRRVSDTILDHLSCEIA
jgi:hypothetical protein